MKKHTKKLKNIKKNDVILEDSKRELGLDILTLIVLFLSIFFFLSLISYSPSDVSNEYQKYPVSDNEQVTNLFGSTGAILSSTLGLYFGWTSFFIPILFLYIALLINRLKKHLTFLMAPFMALLYGVIIISCIAIISGLIGKEDFYFNEISSIAGGIIGSYANKAITLSIGRVGGIIGFSILTIIMLMLQFSVSFSDMNQGLSVIKNAFLTLSHKIVGLFKHKDNTNDNISEINHDNDINEVKKEPLFSKIKYYILDFFEIIKSLFVKNYDNTKEDDDNKTLELSYTENKTNNNLNNDNSNFIDKIKHDDIIDVDPIIEDVIVRTNIDNDNKDVVNELITLPVTEDILKPRFETHNTTSDSNNDLINNSSINNQTTINEEFSSLSDKTIDTTTNSNEIIDSNVEIKDREKIQQAKFLNYNIPLDILSDPNNDIILDSDEEMKNKGELLIQKLNDFGVNGVVRAIQPGPVVTMYEVEPAAGTRVSKIASLESDLALNMSALSIRIIAPIPGKNAVGIEIPNKNRASVSIKELLCTPEFKNSSSKLTVALGKDVVGRPYMSNIAKMPHLLVAGTTGSGKSVGINTMIVSILYKASPDEVKFIMIDPKMVELSVYEGIPHLMAPVVTDTRLASSVLKNVVTEMTRRYTLLKDKKVRNLDGYNEITKDDPEAEKIPYLVVVVDEFADLMMVAGKDVENSIARIAQMARAVGIHLIIATQRPTTNVITGLIKANMPARLSFKVSQKNDSRVILDQGGADTLLGMGDSLFIPPGTSDPIRIHGCFVSDDEVRSIVDYLHDTYGEPEYNMEMVKEVKEGKESSDEDDFYDEHFEDAVAFAYEKETVSISLIQRQFRIGYNRAANIVEEMERRGIIEPSNGTSKPRRVIMN